jgi:hypothetical protein
MFADFGEGGCGDSFESDFWFLYTEDEEWDGSGIGYCFSEVEGVSRMVKVELFYSYFAI